MKDLHLLEYLPLLEDVRDLYFVLLIDLKFLDHLLVLYDTH